jgi:hypothetical protein
MNNKIHITKITQIKKSKLIQIDRKYQGIILLGTKVNAKIIVNKRITMCNQVKY